MNKYLFFLVKLFTLFSVSEASAQYHLILLSGQSNMQGVASKKGYENYQFPSNIIYINFGYTGSDFEVDNEHIGPEIGLAKVLNEKYPNEKFIFFKFAAGGASLLDFNPDYDKKLAEITQTQNFEYLYLKMIQKLDSVMNAYHCSPEVMLWMQGERDAKFVASAKLYEKNLHNFIQVLRNQFNNHSMPFVLGKVSPPAKTYPGLQLVRAAQDNLPNQISKTYIVQTDDLTKNLDRLHYDTKGQIELGKRFADVMVKNQLIFAN